jgi:GNAT superfamily N-acetyltransferase
MPGCSEVLSLNLRHWRLRVSVGPVSIEVRPATIARFDDVAIMLGPKNPDSSVCWCLSHRLDAETNRSLIGRARGKYVKQLCSRTVAPGVLAYDDVEVVGWAAVAPRSELPFARSTRIPHVDHLPVWSVWCIRVRPGQRGKGISHALLDGAVGYARAQGAPAVEGYPVDNRARRSISPWPTWAPASSSRTLASSRLRTPDQSPEGFHAC